MDASLAIAGRVLSGLIILAVGLYCSKIAFDLVTRVSNHKNHALSQIVRIAIIALAATLSFEQIRTAHVLVNAAFGKAQVAISQNHKTNVSLGGTNVAVGGGGYVTGIYLHPLEQNLVYIKTDVGGFYRWNQTNQSWIPLTDHFPLQQSNYYSGEALALDPNNPNLVYIAVGTYTADWWPEKGTIFKSTDKGKTWIKLNLDVKMGGNEELRWVGERLAVDPFNSNVLFFGSRRDGLWKSSDAGITWAKVTSFPGTPTAGIGTTAIVFDKKVRGRVYAIAYGDGLYQSTDTGVTWSKIAGSPDQMKRMVVAPNGVIYATHESGVSKYANGSWSKITPFNSSETFNAISVNPANPNEVLVSLGETTSTKIYQSLDQGATWTEKKRSIKNTVPWWNGIFVSQPWISAIEFDPKVAGRVWLTDWYGIWRTEEIKANLVVWTNYVQGHEEVVVFSLVSPPTGSLLLSGLADVDGLNHNNGLDTYPSQRFGNNGPSFQHTFSIAYCENNPLRMARVGGNDWNNTYSGATSTDGGLTWQEFPSFPANTMPIRVAISATNPNLFVVVVGSGQPLRTTDGGVSWEKVSGLPDGPKGKDPWSFAQPLAADPVDGNIFYYYASGKAYRSNDGGLSFKVIDASLPSEEWQSLKTVPGVKGEVWLSLDQKGLYHSTNSGKFSKLDKVERAYLFAFGKPKPGSTIPALYLYGKINGMGDGIFRSLDRGKTWDFIGDRSKPIGKNPLVMEASKQKFGLVFVGTGGRGIYYGTP